MGLDPSVFDGNDADPSIYSFYWLRNVMNQPRERGTFGTA